MKFIEGSYATSQGAFLAVDRLRARGYKKKDIRLISNDKTRNNYKELAAIEITTESELTDSAKEERSLWERIKDAFSDEDYNEDEIKSDKHLLYAYREDLKNGHIVVLVDGEPRDGIPEGDVHTIYPEENIETLRETEVDGNIGYNRNDSIL